VPALEGWRKSRKLDANDPIAPQIPAFCLSDKPPGASADPTRARGQTLACTCNLLGCHRAFEREKVAGRPQSWFGTSPLSNGQQR
jgi:hypothetical protein